MNKKLLICLTCVLALAFSSTILAKPRGTLRYAVATMGQESTDQIHMESFPGFMLYDKLMLQDEKGNYIPSLAESYSISEDGLTWNFKIREDVKFHNGDPLTAEDVAWSLERFASKESTNPWSGPLRAALVSVEASGKYTVALKTKAPQAPLIVPITWCHILPKKYFQEVGQDAFRKNPVGSGPWKWGKLISKTRMELSANEDYWGQVPAFAKYIEYMVPEEATRVAMIKRGDIDIADGITMDRLIELEKDGFYLQENGPPTLSTLSFQGSYYKESGPMFHKKFRKALSLSVNRKEICETIFSGHCRPGGLWFMNESSWGYPQDFKVDEYNPELAKQYLKEIGYPDKFDDPLIEVNTQAYMADTVEAIVGFWDVIGIQTKINVLDATGYNKFMFIRLTEPTAPNVGSAISWIWGTVSNNVYHSANMFKSTGAHSTGNDPVADQMYDNATSEMNPEIAKNKWAAFMMYTREMYVNVGYTLVPTYVVLGKNIAPFRQFAHLNFIQEKAHFIEPR